jgi:hypothetical protein
MTAAPSENLVGRTRFELVTNGLKVRALEPTLDKPEQHRIFALPLKTGQNCPEMDNTIGPKTVTETVTGRPTD